MANVYHIKKHIVGKKRLALRDKTKDIVQHHIDNVKYTIGFVCTADTDEKGCFTDLRFSGTNGDKKYIIAMCRDIIEHLEDME